MLIKLTDKILQGFRWVLKRYVSKSNELNNSELVMFQDMLRGEGGASSDLKWRGWGYSFPPLVPRHHGYAFRERRCENTATNVFSSFSPALELSILKKNYLYLGTGHYLSAEGGKRILEGISWFLGEYKWESVVTENPKGRIAKKIRRIRKGDQLNLLGKWGHGAEGGGGGGITSVK